MKKSLSFNSRTICFSLFLFSLFLTAISLQASEMNSQMRLLIIATVIFAFVNLFINGYFLFKKHPSIKIPFIIAGIVLIIWLGVTTKPYNTSDFKTQYLIQLKSFNGTPYSWGAETHSGVDCSGLARVALWQAMLKDGISRHNFHIIVHTLWKFWWRDLSASDMENQKYGYTKYIGKTDKIAGYDHKNLLPGDVAIPGGSHVLIYMGDKNWIEASPDEYKVVINKATPNSKRAYFNMKTTFVRWWILGEK